MQINSFFLSVWERQTTDSALLVSGAEAPLPEGRRTRAHTLISNVYTF